ncbi:MAG: LysE family transporter [Zetaproteobacteria bacterium]|nr:LysE family transporter [Zetaproteobacteria bacterium]
MIEYLPEFLTVVVVHLLGVMSPGPDFVLIMQHSLRYSRHIGIYTALGLAAGMLVHVFYSLVGIGFLISRSILLFSTIKLLGAAYLIYLGYKAFRAKPRDIDFNDSDQKQAAINMNPFKALQTGFLTNILNPKVTLFFLALFTQVVSPETPLSIQIIYGLEMAVMTFLWFSFISLALSNKFVQGKVQSTQHIIDRIFGSILIALGIKVASSSLE